MSNRAKEHEAKLWEVAKHYPLQDLDGSDEQQAMMGELDAVREALANNPEGFLGMVLVAAWTNNARDTPEVRQAIAGRSPTLAACGLRTQDNFQIAYDEVLAVGLNEQLKQLENK